MKRVSSTNAPERAALEPCPAVAVLGGSPREVSSAVLGSPAVPGMPAPLGHVGRPRRIVPCDLVLGHGVGIGADATFAFLVSAESASSAARFDMFSAMRSGVSLRYCCCCAAASIR